MIFSPVWRGLWQLHNIHWVVSVWWWLVYPASRVSFDLPRKIGKSPLLDFSRTIEGDSARRVWLVMSEMSFAFWSSSWDSSKQLGRDIFFRLQRVTWYCWFSQRVNSNKGHKLSLLVLTFTKYLEVAIVLLLYADVTRYFYFLLQRVTWQSLFFTRV